MKLILNSYFLELEDYLNVDLFQKKINQYYNLFYLNKSKREKIERQLTFFIDNSNSSLECVNIFLNDIGDLSLQSSEQLLDSLQQKLHQLNMDHNQFNLFIFLINLLYFIVIFKKLSLVDIQKFLALLKTNFNDFLENSEIVYRPIPVDENIIQFFENLLSKKKNDLVYLSYVTNMRGLFELNKIKKNDNTIISIFCNPIYAKYCFVQ